MEVENVFKILDQQIGDDQADLRGSELASDFLRVLPLLNSAEDGGVGRRPTDAALFKLFDQRSFVKARRRFCEMLLWEQRF